MEKIVRKIIKIDKDLCDGCGLCAEACHEGAIQIINGKAVLVSDIYCDGLGDCIGECPRGAISFEEREAMPYDEEAVKNRMALMGSCSGGCPGSISRSLETEAVSDELRRENVRSELKNWPVQLRLVPENAPYLFESNIVMAADCSAFAHPDFHRSFLGKGTVCLIGCPKLDDSQFYLEKLIRLIKANKPKSITVVYMVVPCCGKLVKVVERALEEARVSLDYIKVQISLEGREVSREVEKYRFS